MKRSISLLGVLMLVLLLWTGGTARAAEGYSPIAVSAESIGHFAGDKDQAPSDEHESGTHHHSGCGEHHADACREISIDSVVPFAAGLRLTPSVLEVLSREPETQLRPPIA